MWIGARIASPNSMQALVFANFASIAAGSLFSFLEKDFSGVQAVLEHSKSITSFTEWIGPDVKGRLIPLTTGVLLLGMTYGAIWRSHLRSR